MIDEFNEVLEQKGLNAIPWQELSDCRDYVDTIKNLKTLICSHCQRARIESEPSAVEEAQFKWQNCHECDNILKFNEKNPTKQKPLIYAQEK